MTTGLEIIVGIYEGYVIGLRAECFKTETGAVKNVVKVRKSFAGQLHTSSVRCLTTRGKFLASGGADDRIRLYDLETRNELQDLLYHNGTVNALAFTESADYLISGADDGRIVFLNTATWRIDKVWERAHKGAVRCIALHSTGKLALSVGADAVLKTWNLITGRNIYSTSFKNKAAFRGGVEAVRWSSDGLHFAVMGDRAVEVLSLETGKVVRTYESDERLTTLCWIDEEELLVGREDGKLIYFTLEEDDEVITMAAHDSRIKAMDYVEGYLVTVASSGELSLWYVTPDAAELQQVCVYDLNCRPTCVCLVESTKLGIFEQIKIKDEEKVDEETEMDSGLKGGQGRVTVEYEEDAAESSRPKKKKNKQKKKNFVSLSPQKEKKMHKVSEKSKGISKKKKKQ